MMDEEAKAVLMFVTVTFILLGGIICALAYDSDNHERHNCQIEGMRANRTVAEIVEICR